MDKGSQELQNFLIALGQNPGGVSDKITRYMQSILHLLSVPEESALILYYGLFGNNVRPLDYIASSMKVSEEEAQRVIETALRRLSVTPEWQMLKGMVC